MQSELNQFWQVVLLILDNIGVLVCVHVCACVRARALACLPGRFVFRLCAGRDSDRVPALPG